MEFFKIKCRDKKTLARIGVLTTKSGKIETPFFMPVATKGAVKFVDSKKLEDLGTKAVISNAFILSIRPGSELIKKLGGIKKFMSFSGINFTDSGGFQMYSDSLYINSNNNGVYFKNPFSGEKIFMNPEKNMKIQLDIGADVAMCLDSMPLYSQSKDEIEKAVNRTLLWAKKCKTEHERLQSKIPKYKRQLLFSISQGGIYGDLREYCCKELLKLDFDGYAIGGIALPEFCYTGISSRLPLEISSPETSANKTQKVSGNGDMGMVKKLEQNIIKIHRKIIPENKPVYLMGEGDPIWMLEAISLGCDMFDSRMPTQNARHGTLFTSNGKLKILNKKYENDSLPIDKKCKCFVCKNFNRAYLRSLLKEEEPVGKELASYHNLFYMNELISNAKKEIKKGKFKDFLKKMKRVYNSKNR